MAAMTNLNTETCMCLSVFMTVATGSSLVQFSFPFLLISFGSFKVPSQAGAGSSKCPPGGKNALENLLILQSD